MHSFTLEVRSKGSFTIWTIQESLVTVSTESSGKNADVSEDTLEQNKKSLSRIYIKSWRLNRPQEAYREYWTFCTAQDGSISVYTVDCGRANHMPQSSVRR